MKATIRSDDRGTTSRAGVHSHSIQAQATGAVLADRRPAAVAQRRLQMLADASSRGQQERTLAARIGAGPTGQAREPVQRVAATPDDAGQVVQRVTDLHVQQGPSCWLFVLEAVARSGGVGTDAMRMIMESYASSDDANAQVKKASKELVPRAIGRRQAALEVTAARLAAMVTALQAYRGGQGALRNGGMISRKIAGRYARAHLDSERSVEYLTFDQGGMAPIGGVIDQYEKARDRAATLLGIVKDEEDDVGSLLQSGSLEFDAKADISDVRLTLENVPAPAYMSIRKRFSPTPQELQAGNVVDFTSRKVDTLKDTAHAVMLEHYDKTKKIVSYKDPNFGNVIFQVRIGQLRAMANAERVMIRPFIKSGANKSRLAEIAD